MEWRDIFFVRSVDMINIVAQLEKRFLSEFTSAAAKDLYARIPERLRQNVLIRKQNCRPYGTRADIIRWGAPDNAELEYVCFGSVTADSVTVFVMPNPAVGADDYDWYTESSLRGALAGQTAAQARLVSQRTADGSMQRLCLRELPWAAVEAALPAIIQWTRRHQSDLLCRHPQRGASIAASVGLKEFEMVALVLKTMGGSAPFDDICQKYAALFGFTLTDAITDGVQQVLVQHTSETPQFLGGKNLFRKLDGDVWALR